MEIDNTKIEDIFDMTIEEAIMLFGTDWLCKKLKKYGDKNRAKGILYCGNLEELKEVAKIKDRKGDKDQ